MYIVPGLDDIKVAYINLKFKGIELFGLLLYSDSDVALVEYMQKGITELDIMSGEDCVIFVIEPPSSKWFKHVRQRNHIWWESYGNKFEKNHLVNELQESLNRLTQEFKTSNFSVFIGNQNIVELRNLLNEQYNYIYDRQEALNIAKHFSIGYSSLPCLVFFNDLESDKIAIKRLGDHQDQTSLKQYFREFFDSDEFKALLERGVN